MIVAYACGVSYRPLSTSLRPTNILTNAQCILVSGTSGYKMSHLLRKPTMWSLNRSDTNQSNTGKRKRTG